MRSSLDCSSNRRWAFSSSRRCERNKNTKKRKNGIHFSYVFGALSKMGHIDQRRLGDQGLTFNFRFSSCFSP